MPSMSLRPLLSHFADDPDASRFAREGGRAFVSASYRPFVVGALLDGVDGPLAGRPALVVAADDRQARDLAADLRHWLPPAPRAPPLAPPAAGPLLPEPRRRLRVAPRAAAAPRRPARRRARRAARV